MSGRVYPPDIFNSQVPSKASLPLHIIFFVKTYKKVLDTAGKQVRFIFL